MTTLNKIIIGLIVAISVVYFLVPRSESTEEVTTETTDTVLEEDFVLDPESETVEEGELDSPPEIVETPE